MEDRPDLEELLVSGLAADERQRIVRGMSETTAAKLRRKPAVHRFGIL
jgi:hypothetical protein